MRFRGQKLVPFPSLAWPGLPLPLLEHPFLLTPCPYALLWPRLEQVAKESHPGDTNQGQKQVSFGIPPPATTSPGAGVSPSLIALLSLTSPVPCPPSPPRTSRWSVGGFSAPWRHRLRHWNHAPWAGWAGRQGQDERGGSLSPRRSEATDSGPFWLPHSRECRRTQACKWLSPYTQGTHAS